MKAEFAAEAATPAASESRRRFLRALALASAGWAAMAAEGNDSKTTQGKSNMDTPIEVVRRFCAAWSNEASAAELAAFFTDNAIYHNIPLEPVAGKKAIENNFATFIRPGPPGIESLHLRILHIAANGPVVMTERVDTFKVPDKTFELELMGIFEVHDGKISAWRDYFDLNQFTTRMG